MSTYRRPVVVGVDGSAAALAAVRWGAATAAREGTALRLVHAYELPLGSPSGVTEEGSVLDALRREGRRRLARARDAARAVTPAPVVETVLSATPAASGLLRESEDASVLVLGNRGRGVLTGLLVGSTALALAGRVRCPLVLVPAAERDEAASWTGPVLVGVDGTDASEAAVGFAFAEAAAREAPLLAVHAWSESVLETALAADDTPADRTLQHRRAEQTLAERLAAWREKYPRVPVERAAVQDRPVRALRRRSGSARLIVVGSRGHGGLRGVLGSTSRHLLHHTTCPVVVVRTGTTE